MERRKFIKNTTGAFIAAQPLVKLWSGQKLTFSQPHAGPKKPVFIYNNWSAYDELSDKVALTETLAMKELQEVLRLKSNGVKIDYYVMDAFWFDISGGYRIWNKKHWENGPNKWLQTCLENNIRPGMWFSTNLVVMSGKRQLTIIPEWEDSVATDTNILCLFDGGYLNHLHQTLQLWHDKGVRVFKFDFAYFEAVTPRLKDKFSKEEIIEKNKVAFIKMLQQFREKNKDILIIGYNGFGGDMENTYLPFNKKIDSRWLDVFDTLYCGDPRFSDVPMKNIWRSEDNYSDHQVFAYHAYGLPYNRIDNCAFMIGTTGTCYSRKTNCWKGMLILELARGGWINVYHGNLELLTNNDAVWFAKVQHLFYPLQNQNNVAVFGEIPGKGKPYGFSLGDSKGSVCTVVNPSQHTATIYLPIHANSYLLYADGGFNPVLKNNTITLGPEQLAVVGTGKYADEKYSLGIDESINIPATMETITANFKPTDKNKIEANIYPIKNKNIRIVLQQFDSKGFPYRNWGGAPPDGTRISDIIKINVKQNNIPVKTNIETDKMIWSGLSWSVAEINYQDIDAGEPVTIQCSSSEKNELILKAQVYAVGYKNI